MTDNSFSGGGVPAQDDPRIVQLMTDPNWSHLTEEDRRILAAGEVAAMDMRRRGLSEWLALGHEGARMRELIYEQVGATSGRAYNRAYAAFHAPEFKALHPSDRTQAVWLWEKRDEIEEWRRSDSRVGELLNHPLVIKQHYDRYRRARGDTPEEEHLQEQREPHRSSNAALNLAIAQRLEAATDGIERVSGAVPPLYSLDDPRRAAMEFYNAHSGIYGADAVREFALELQSLSDGDIQDVTPPRPRGLPSS